MTTAAPDLPDWTAGHQPVTVPTYLGEHTVAANGGQAPDIDVSAFESVTIVPVSGSSAEWFAFFQTILPNTGQEITVGPQVWVAAPLTLDCLSGILSIANNGSGSGKVSVFGNGRSSALKSQAIAGWQAEPWEGTILSTVWAINTTNQFIPTGILALPQGLCTVFASISNTAVTGLLYAQTNSGGNFIFADSGMFHPSPTGMSLSINVGLPADVFAISYQAKAAGTASATCYVCPAY